MNREVMLDSSSSSSSIIYCLNRKKKLSIKNVFKKRRNQQKQQVTKMKEFKKKIISFKKIFGLNDSLNILDRGFIIIDSTDKNEKNLDKDNQLFQFFPHRRCQCKTKKLPPPHHHHHHKNKENENLNNGFCESL